MNDKSKKIKLSEKLNPVIEILRDKGIECENICGDDVEGVKVKVVCIEPNLGWSVKKMGEEIRGETIMVRIDEKTRKKLDAWVETGYFKSRSEAAALFIREGLKIRSSELDQLKDALKDVTRAKNALRDRAKEIFGKEEKSS
jgi:Arc/MetJ-type ribon-helix-helix transcriptional regulator